MSPIESPIEAFGRGTVQATNFNKELLKAQEEIEPEDIYDAIEKWAKATKPVLEIGFGVPATGIGKAIEPIWEHMREEEVGYDPTINYKVEEPF